MSAISGVFYFDPHPVPEVDDARVRGQRYQAPGLAMAQNRSWDSDAECAVSPGVGACAWDGRLDNHESLRMRFAREVPPAASSAGLALRVYGLRGVEGLRDLIGDWSAAIWDETARKVVLASDYAGIRPLYYHVSRERVVWSSSLGAVVDWTGIGELDEGYVAQFLSHGDAAGCTPYRGIYPVPPGHAVVVSTAGASIQRFWEFPVDQDLRMHDDRDYEEGLRTLFREAVAVRLRARTPVCAELSGGLDSSSIVCMAHQLVESRRMLVTFSYTHEGCRDERYFTAVERACGIEGIHLDLHGFPLVSAADTGGAAPALWGLRFAELARQMKEKGSGVFLTGQLGDFIMGQIGDDSEQVADYLHRGQLRQACREALDWSRALEVPIYSILWRAFRTAHSSWAAPLDTGIWGNPPSRFTRAESLTRKLQELLNGYAEDERRDARWTDAAPSRRRRFKLFSQLLERRRLQTPEALQHISYTHPYVHRPLVEFMLTIPPAQVCRPGESRRLMRRAFQGLLPDVILKRQSKAGYESPYRRALLPLAAEMAARPDRIRLIESGFAERDSLIERLRRFAEGLECKETQLRNLILFEFWLRARERSAATGRSPADQQVACATPS